MSITRVTSDNIKDADVTTADIANDAVTFAKMQNISTDRLIGRDTAATGDPEEISVSGGLEWTGSAGIQRSALTGDVTASAGSNATTLVQASGSFAFVADITPPQITALQSDYNPTGMSTALVLRLDTSAEWVITGFAGGSDGRILIIHNIGANNLGLKSESNASSAANRMAFEDDQVSTRYLGPKGAAILQYDATVSRWRLLSIAGGKKWIDFTMLLDSITDRLIGRDTTGTGSLEYLTVSGGLEFTGSGGIQRSALTGDVTASAGSNATTLVQGSSSFALTGDITPSQITASQNDYNPTGLSTASVLRLDTSAKWSITGLQGGADGRIIIIHNKGTQQFLLPDESASSTAANRFAFSMGDLTLYPDDCVTLQYDSTSSRWRCIGASSEQANAIDFTRMQDIGTDKLIGRDAAGTGDPAEISVSGGLEFSGSNAIQRSALTGDVTASAGSNATTIANDAVTYAKIQNVSATDKVLGRSTAGSGDVEEITCTSFGRSLIDDTSAYDASTTLKTSQILRKRVLEVFPDANDITWQQRGWKTTPTFDSFDAALAAPSTRPYARVTTAGTSGSAGGIKPTNYGGNGESVRTEWFPEYAHYFGTRTVITSYRVWCGFTSASLDGVATPTTQHVAAVSYDTGRDGTAFWRCITCDGASNVTTTTTSTAIATSSFYDIWIVFTSASSVDFWINGTLVATHTTNLPGSTTLISPVSRVTTLTNQARQGHLSDLRVCHN